MSQLDEARQELRDALVNKRLIVCVGSGGVGKTTTAAALAVEAARMGRRVIVVTIDPARRLANSLGLEALGNDERAIPTSKFSDHGIEAAGSMHAMMLDSGLTFDEVVSRVAGDDETRDRILGNRIYRHMSETLSASQEYMASEKLYDLYHSGRYDLVVLDTPPMKNAIDFLEASGRLSRFLDEKIMGWFLRPHASGLIRGSRLLQGPVALVYRLLGSVFGNEFLDDLSEFFLAFKDLYGGFRERAEFVGELLRDGSQCRFTVVCTPRSMSMEEARYFHGQLRERQMPGDLFIVNQCGRCGGLRPADEQRRYLGEPERRALADITDGLVEPAELRAFAERLEVQLEHAVALGDDDLRAIADLRAFAGMESRVCTVPRLEEDVYDFGGLLAITDHLLGPR